MRFRMILTLALFLAHEPLTSSAAHLVTVRCDQPDLVAGRELCVVRHDEPRPRRSTSKPLDPAPRFDRLGTCQVRLDTGTYRFDVLARDGSTLVALTTGRTEVDGEATLTIRTQKPRPIRLLRAGKELALDRVTLRSEGTLTAVEWPGPGGDRETHPQVVLSPGQDFPVRLIGRETTPKGVDSVVLWAALDATRTDTDLAGWAGWLGRSGFRWAGTGEGLRRVKDPAVTLYFPEGDELKLPLAPGAALVTNRRLVELSYAYETAAGERLEFNRRGRVLEADGVIDWGGPLTPAAYARVAMKWDKPGRSLLWGAYLYNAAGDVVSLNDFPPEKPHRRLESGHPTYLTFRQPFAAIGYKQTLHRLDGGPVPADPENLTERDLAAIGDVNRLHENYLVAVSYVLDGKVCQHNVTPDPFVTWRTKHVALEAPRHWNGRAAAYLDKMERVYEICKPLGRYTPERVQLFWTNNYGAGYTVGPPSNKRIQMGFFDLRDRKDLFSLPDVLVHEVLHAFGHVHGREHDAAIGQGERVFARHRAYLADTPAYLPEPVRVDFSVEDARDFGAEDHDRYVRVEVPREVPRRGDGGRFRGHVPDVPAAQAGLREVLALKDAPPAPADWKDAVDLLAAVDLENGVVAGKWEKPGGQLVSAEKPYARVRLPGEPKGSYQLEVQFTRVRGDCFAVLLPVGKTRTCLIVSGWGGKVSGLAHVGGKDADRNETTRDGALRDGRKHTLQVTVRLLADERARVTVTLDGGPYVDWTGPRSALTPDREWALPDADAVGLGAYDSRVVVHSCRLKTFDAPGR